MEAGLWISLGRQGIDLDQLRGKGAYDLLHHRIGQRRRFQRPPRGVAVAGGCALVVTLARRSSTGIPRPLWVCARGATDGVARAALGSVLRRRTATSVAVERRDRTSHGGARAERCMRAVGASLGAAGSSELRAAA